MAEPLGPCLLPYCAGSRHGFGFSLYSHRVLCLDLEPLTGKEIGRKGHQLGFSVFAAAPGREQRGSDGRAGARSSFPELSRDPLLPQRQRAWARPGSVPTLCWCWTPAPERCHPPRRSRGFACGHVRASPEGIDSLYSPSPSRLCPCHRSSGQQGPPPPPLPSGAALPQLTFWLFSSVSPGSAFHEPLLCSAWE